MINKYSYGGGQNTYKINPLFKDIKEYNKYLLSLIGIFVLLLSGIISYSYTNTSYAKWSNSVESGNILKLYVKGNDENLDTSGANKPALTSNMIPVYYDSTNNVWRKADATNSNESNKWYDYNNKMWANAVTVTDTLSSKYKEKIDKNVSLNLSSSPEFGWNAPVTINNTEYDYVDLMIYYNNTSIGIFNISGPDGSLIITEAQLDGQVNLLSYDDYTWEEDYDFSSGVIEGSLSDLYNNNGMKLSDYIDEYGYAIIMFNILGSNAFYIDSYDGSDYTMYSIGQLYLPNYLFGKSYTFDEKTELYTLTNTSYNDVDTDVVDKYYCPSNTTVCSTMYKINSVSDHRVTSADKYTKEGVPMARLTLKDGTTKSCSSSVCKRNDIVSADMGTEIPMSSINTMWVWIPRYTYTYLNTNTPEEIQIKFESGTNSSGTIKCTDAVTGTSTTSETCTDSTNGSIKAGTSTYTHPAFWWDKNDNNVRESGEELTGIWVGKFEVSSDTTCIASSNAAVGSRCNLQTIRPLIKPDVQSWRGAQVGTFFNGIYNMRESGNQYGFATTDETHMMKNMEWGAVAYLSHSKYGINKEININNSYDFYTGRSGGNVGGSTAINTVYTDQTSTTQYNKYGFYTYDGYLLSYNTNTKSSTRDMSKIASSTGNITGIYDLSGGATEYMMSNMVWTNGQVMSGNSTSNNHNSAFTGILYDSNKGTSFTGTYSFPSKRYYDKYSFGTANTEYTRGKLGDATVEMAPTGTSGNWYSDYAGFPYNYSLWFIRGGNYSRGASAGAFYFVGGDGSAATGCSTRAVLTIN